MADYLGQVDIGGLAGSFIDSNNIVGTTYNTPTGFKDSSSNMFDVFGGTSNSRAVPAPFGGLESTYTIDMGGTKWVPDQKGGFVNEAGGSLTAEQFKLGLSAQTPDTNFMGLTAGETAQGLAGVAGLGLSAYLGNQQLGLMKDQLNLQKDQLKTTQADVGYKADGGVGSTRKSRSAAAASRAFG